MARPIRVEFKNAVYHVTARGNERRDIYRDGPDCERFLETLEEATERFGLLVHDYCLMPNYYHLLLQAPRANLSDAGRLAPGPLFVPEILLLPRQHRRFSEVAVADGKRFAEESSVSPGAP